MLALEGAETAAFEDVYRSAEPQVVESSGLVVKGLEEGVVLAATRLDVLALVAPRFEALGLRHHNNWMRLTRRVTDIPDLGSTSLRVDVIGPESGSPFSAIVAEAFQYPSAIAGVTEGVVGRPEWTHYLAYFGGKPVAAAAMYVRGEAAWFGFAATDAAHRGRGAQTALVLRRLRDAAAAGCSWVSVETAEQTPDKEAPSFRNLRRLGFEVAYRRPNYL